MEESRLDLELPKQMAHLGIMEVDVCDAKAPEEKVESPSPSSRVLRKRKSIATPMKANNRRVSMKPRKHVTMMNENANPKQIEALYLAKTVKTLSQTLETIYEEPKTDSNNATFISGKKVKRQLTFQIGGHYTKEKIKKRRAKIKKLLGNKSFLNRKKIPMPVFLKTIKCLELDEAIGTEIGPDGDKVDL